MYRPISIPARIAAPGFDILFYYQPNYIFILPHIISSIFPVNWTKKDLFLHISTQKQANLLFNP
jgi:hypothetical protein